MFDIKRFCFDYKLTQVEFANIIGEAQPVISHMIKGSRKVRLEHIEKLRAKYGDVVDNYRNDRPAQTVKPATMSPAPQHSAGLLHDVQGVYSTGNVIEQPPIVPDSVVRKPNLDLMSWAESKEAEHANHVFDISEILRKTKIIIKTDDNSMSPTLFQNEYVFLKPMPAEASIIDGKCYGIDTRSHGAIIRLLYDNGDTITAVPVNKQYGVMEIPREDVIRIYYIIFHGSTHTSLMPDIDSETSHRDVQISQQGEQISSLIEQLDKSGQRQDRLLEQNAQLISRIFSED